MKRLIPYLLLVTTTGIIQFLILSPEIFFSRVNSPFLIVVLLEFILFPIIYMFSWGVRVKMIRTRKQLFDIIFQMVATFAVFLIVIGVWMVFYSIPVNLYQTPISYLTIILGHFVIGFFYWGLAIELSDKEILFSKLASQQSKVREVFRSQQLGHPLHIVCPQCTTTNPFYLLRDESFNKVPCFKCHLSTNTIIAKIRTKKSRSQNLNRYFEVRIFDLNGTEDLITFDNYNGRDFPLHSGDLVAFSYLEGRVAGITNLTIGRYLPIGDGDMNRWTILFISVFLFALPMLCCVVIAIHSF